MPKTTCPRIIVLASLMVGQRGAAEPALSFLGMGDPQKLNGRGLP